MENLYNGKYSQVLCDYFGSEILHSENDLIPEFRIELERKRLLHNRKRAYRFSFPDIWKAGHILFLLTNKCNLKCPHCYTFAGPDIRESLPSDAWLKLCGNRYLQDAESISVSGGEVFLYDDFFRFISRYPIDSLVTNGQWAKDIKTARIIADEFYRAITIQPKSKTKQIDFCLSIDSFHTGDHDLRLERILHVIRAFSELDLNIVFKLFHFRNYGKEHSVNLFLQHFRRTFGKSKPKICFENFHCSYSGRGIFLRKNLPLPKDDLEQILHYNPYIDTNEQYQYVVSANGNISVYDILNIVPYPLSAGNIVYDEMDEIIQNLATDPIVNLIRMLGTKQFLYAMAQKFPIVKKIIKFSHSTQQALYLFMLNSATMEKVNEYSYTTLTKISKCVSA